MTLDLINLIKSKKTSIFYDISLATSFTLWDLIDPYTIIEEFPKKLAFLYLDNSIISVSALLGFLSRGQTIALFKDKLASDLKLKLEYDFQPHFIYDNTRNFIDGFQLLTTLPNSRESKIFLRLEQNKKYTVSPHIDALISTSGSTGSPKLVKLSQKNLLENALSIIDYLPIESSDITPLNLPLDYSYGLSILTTNLISGGTIISSCKNNIDKRFWSDFTEFKMTSFAGTPPLYEMLLSLGFLSTNLPSLRYFTQAGGKLKADIVNTLVEYSDMNGKDFFVMYGQTEASPRMSYIKHSDLKHRPNSIGKPVKNGSFEIYPETKELIFNGPNIFGGYASSYSDLDTFLFQESLNTGDIARMDESGFYYIVGRSKRFIKLLGERINLDEIEHILCNRFLDKTFFVCLSQADEKLFIIMKIGCENLKSQVCDYLYKNLRIPTQYIDFLFLESLPLTQNGKVDYTHLKSLLHT
ncbi:MAG: AMP-binding protein [Sphaerospermopsis kisseleviana]|uniref:AMP-binding protein n=1 Tax=Sphaerospermopsis sp. FACHB-1194 TaxID=2692862 RepID=UPI00168011CB|nr:AMP-binding protein [Sphaerospermopsis sp. FACHB-1194]MBD2143840.1 AMP-binding protein [Sphaerospermopsis sp. FACHB-1194]